jgi:hypothetical protein
MQISKNPAAPSDREQDGTTNLIKHSPQKRREEEAKKKAEAPTLADLWPA